MTQTKKVSILWFILLAIALVGIKCDWAKAQGTPDRSVNVGAQVAHSFGGDIQSNPTYGAFAQLNWKLDPCVAPGCWWTPRGEARVKVGHTTKQIDGSLLTYSFGNLFLQPVFVTDNFRLSLAGGIGRSYAWAYEPHSRWKKGLTTLPVGIRADIGHDHHFGANYIFVKEDDKQYPNNPKSIEGMYRYTGPIGKNGWRYFAEGQYTHSRFTSPFYPGRQFRDNAITVLLGIGKDYQRK